MSDVARWAEEAEERKSAEAEEIVVLEKVVAHLNRQPACAKSLLAVAAIQDAIHFLRARDAAREKAAG